MALSEVAENDSRQNRNEKTRHKINTKNINNSTIVSDNLEKSNHTGALLFPFPPSNSSSFLKRIKNSKNGADVVRLDSETISEAGEGLIFSQSHVLVLIDFLINHLILHHQHLFFISFEVLMHHHPSLHLLLLQDLAADLAAADSGALLASLQGLLPGRIDKLLVRIHGGEPEAVLIGEVVAGALGAVALDERRRAEILQAGAGGHQGLTAALSAGCCVLQRRGERISREGSKNASLPV